MILRSFKLRLPLHDGPKPVQDMLHASWVSNINNHVRFGELVKLPNPVDSRERLKGDQVER